MSSEQSPGTGATSAAAQPAQPVETGVEAPAAPVDLSAMPAAEPAATAEKAKPPKPKAPGSNRGLETLFRTNYRMHTELTAIADTKANMVISINGIVVSIAIALVVPNLQDYAWVLPAVTILLVGCVTSLAFAVLAARPRVSRDPVTLEQVRRNEANVLYFGHFVNMSRDDFVRGMHELMQNREILYDNMVRDLYGLGSVLARKYEHLRTSYTALLLTAVGTVAAFLVLFGLRSL